MASNRFHEAVAKIASTKPQLFLQQATQLSNCGFRVLASFGETKLELSAEDLDQMLAETTNNYFRTVADTIQPLQSTNSQIVFSMIIESNTAVKDYDEDYIKNNMRALAANVFVDKGDDSIWRVQTGDNESEKYLVQSVKENFRDLLSERLARSAGVLASTYNGIVPASGDYVEFYDPEYSSLAYGYALIDDQNKLMVLERQSGKRRDITPAHVTMAVDGSVLDKKYNLTAKLETMRQDNMVVADGLSSSQLDDVLAYLRHLYGGTPYYDDIEKQVRAAKKRNKQAIFLNHV